MLKTTKDQFTANFYALVVLMSLCSLILVANSLQMCYQAENSDDTVNAIVFISLFALVKTWLYGCPHLFIFTFYPIEQYSFIYALLTIPTIGFHWVVDPLFKLIITGDDIADADFAPVSIGFAVVCGVTVLSVIYTFVVGRRLIESEKTGDMTTLEGKSDDTITQDSINEKNEPDEVQTSM